MNQNMMTWQNFNNFGMITQKLPPELFEKLSQECNKAKDTRDGINTGMKELKSGLTGKGVAPHYYIEDCKQELNSYTMNMFNSYEKHFSYCTQFKSFNKSIQVTNTEPWVNVQKKHEFIPLHHHDGICAWVVWIKIPYDINEETQNNSCASTFSFAYFSSVGTLMIHTIPVSKEMEGTIIMFPSSLHHQVYPFYTSDDVRMSISGMITFDTTNLTGNNHDK